MQQAHKMHSYIPKRVPKMRARIAREEVGNHKEGTPISRVSENG